MSRKRPPMHSISSSVNLHAFCSSPKWRSKMDANAAGFASWSSRTSNRSGRLPKAAKIEGSAKEESAMKSTRANCSSEMYAAHVTTLSKKDPRRPLFSAVKPSITIRGTPDAGKSSQPWVLIKRRMRQRPKAAVTHDKTRWTMTSASFSRLNLLEPGKIKSRSAVIWRSMPWVGQYEKGLHNCCKKILSSKDPPASSMCATFK
mmetsp:Transcript_68381/g.198210  ORF Transcript_68381/g.198210 Transcript_68381/m.198210 type:complete len:203 (-) Transcript_68381:1477-2085(-)